MTLMEQAYCDYLRREIARIEFIIETIIEGERNAQAR
jgi:hypothetical protein